MTDTAEIRDQVVQNHETLQKVFEARGIEKEFTDDVTGAKARQKAAFMGLGVSEDAKQFSERSDEEQLAALVEQNAANIHALAVEEGVSSQSLFRQAHPIGRKEHDSGSRR